MKYIKTFEQNNNPKVGDYILTNYNLDKPIHNIFQRKLQTFLNKNIGKVVGENNVQYVIEYNNIPPELEKYFNNLKNYIEITPEIIKHFNNLKKNTSDFIVIYVFNIRSFSKNKEDLEPFLYADMFNI